MIDPLPMLSLCARAPWRTYVMISMSRCGCMGNPPPGATISSLMTRSERKPVQFGSRYWSNENLCRARAMQSEASRADGFLKAGIEAMRLQSRSAILLALVLAGCGGRATPPAGFINHTRHSDAELASLWKSAQQNLSQQIDLNPLEQELNNAAPQIVSGDARVWTVSKAMRVRHRCAWCD